MSIRPSLLLSALLVLAVGCGGSSSDHDAAVSTQDLSSGEGCYSIAECAFECTAGNATCVQSCVAKGTTVAQAAYATLSTCGYGLCTGAADGGAAMDGDGGSSGACATATDTSAACTQCVQDAIHSTTCESFVTTCANE